MFGLGKTRWAVFDCLTGAFLALERLPFEIGSEDGADLRLNGDGVAARHCAICRVKGRDLCLVRRDPDGRFCVDGAAAESVDLEPDRDYSLEIGSHLLLVRGGKDLDAWRAELDPNVWLSFNPETNQYEGGLPLLDLCRQIRRQGFDPEAVVLPKGAQMGFYLRHVLNLLSDQLGPPEVLPDAGAGDSSAEFVTLNPDHGALTCPVCWLKFDAGDVMHVAVHDSLRGDPILGADALLRFHATRFNDRSQALDAFGLPCTDIACPHCRRVLPPGFLEAQHHIFSIVGDQSAGKSYYLSVLIKQLPVSLYENFGVVFQDADPSGNAMLNEMKRTLFSAVAPEQARLVKTQLEGAMYERLPRYGRIAALPKPFVYDLAAVSDAARRSSVIFYDNAGEHFQPGRDSADSPGAQHVASSSGILFLFDPFNNPAFRRRMAGHPDPQIERPILDQQDVILSELKTRAKRLLNLSAEAKLATPLAVLVGKCDAWMQWLGETPFENPVVAGRLNREVIGRNSAKVRALLRELAPTVVANAETISQSVAYFPVSAFGHSPVKIGAGDYVPDPRQLNPFQVEVPVLWLLAHVERELVPQT